MHRPGDDLAVALELADLADAITMRRYGAEDLVIEAKADLAPLPVIIEEAGGRFSDFAGERTLSGGSAIVTNGLVHDAALAIVGHPGRRQKLRD